jgi:hypothetical protein
MPQNLRRAIAAFLGIGAVIGLAIVLNLSRSVPTPVATRNVLTLTLALLLMAFTTVAAWLLWRDHPLGYSLGIWALALQVPHLDLPGLSYSLYTTGRLTLWASADFHIGMLFDWGSGFTLALSGSPDSARLGVNLVALSLGWRLLVGTEARDAVVLAAHQDTPGNAV